ncbi:hypothetical protein CLV78_105237 [Aliiruegeria haliotis]|uniref:Uncharacterized protein n=1 Tax=Aliiruegeria haliotis TaxID=1280846 RepID=A0A2T0RQ18_9RHOB|nr:hypothetical protein [Aliiruegeria haliotis]PRY23183.1 hypothetical protein CLV78_105237 [Aliiruegeria haliotis]
MKTKTSLPGLFGLAIIATLAVGSPMVASAGASNLSQATVGQARKAGVPESCIAKMTHADIAVIKSISGKRRLSVPTRQRRTREYVKKICRRP